MLRHESPYSIVRGLRPEVPVICARPERAKAAARWFLDAFEGEVLYAVKVNPSPWVLDALWDAGVRWFDVASEAEVELVGSRFKGANLAFMHPVKTRRAIARAYSDFGCRIFVLDTHDELHKILEATQGAKDLTLVVRAAVSGKGSLLPLSGKFGAALEELPELLRATRAYAAELGVSFHVGSQCMDPGAYREAMADVSDAIKQAGVTVDIVDVGGGFPSVYPGMNPPPLQAYMDAIHEAFEDMMVLGNADLWCEPGRALVAEAASVLCRVDLVKPGALYINDGSYGALYDAAHERWRYPTRCISSGGRELSGDLVEWKVYGPTCDSTDKFAEGVWLPASLREGDYIEFGNLGGYGSSMATRFNGFGAFETVGVADRPFASLFPMEAPAQVAKVLPFRRLGDARRPR
jgi:ornithine decarboxylase